MGNLAQVSLDSDMVFSDGYSLQMAKVSGSVSQGYQAHAAGADLSPAALTWCRTGPSALTGASLPRQPGWCQRSLIGTASGASSWEGHHDRHHPELEPAAAAGHRPPPRPGARGGPPIRALRYVGAAIRLSLGWIFLWAFLDKLFGLGHETASKDAWVNGGSPTTGFLKFAAAGPFKDFYNGIAGSAWADWLFMLGLAAIGIGLIAGVAMRLTAAAGVLMLVLMWSAVLPPANNPFMDDHIIYALVIVALALGHAGHTLGLGRVWEQLAVVRRFRWLR